MAMKTSAVKGISSRPMEGGAEGGPLGATLVQEFKNLRDKLKIEEEYQNETPFQNLEKAAVLQDCRVFHDSAVVTQNPRKCCQLITKLLFLLVKGESFSSNEVTEVFFGVTKLFQSKDVNLRRMTYLFIKDVADTCNPDDVIIVTSSLTKDMNTGEDLYRANSMRVLAKIIDATMLGAIERYLKQAIVDKNSFVASSALVTGLHLFKSCPDIVRRWINEVQEAVNSSAEMVQYHALSLLYKIKQHDRLAVAKTVTQLSKGSLRSPLATCLLIRYTSSLLREDISVANAKTAYQFLEQCLRHKHDMVIYEAAKAICALPNIEPQELNSAVTILQMYLSSSKPVMRFCSMKVLSEVAMRFPACVAKCTDDMETLVSDINRSTATLAITTLLKVGNESSVDRLMKQISAFMTDIGDEFKIVVISAIRELCIRYPAKHRTMIAFLATFLREEGGFDFKKSIVNSIVDLMMAIPETKDTCLLHLCEFIEDCEFDELIVQILYLVGSTGPMTNAPSRYIRFVFNRVILENAVVRAAAVSTLGMFAFSCAELRPSILVLLSRSVTDEDDEVRDRTTVLLKILDQKENLPALNDDDVGPSVDTEDVLNSSLPMSFSALEASVTAYMAYPAVKSSPSKAQPVTFGSLPIIEEASVPALTAASKKSSTTASAVAVPSSSGSGSTVAATATPTDAAAILYRIPEFANYGRCFRSSPEVALTETEMEYVVRCVKHIFDGHIVLQFIVMNTIEDQLLKNCHVQIAIDEEEAYTVDAIVKTSALYQEPANCFVSLVRNEAPSPATISCELHFNVVQVTPGSNELVDEDDAGYEDEYPLESLDIDTCDYMAKVSMMDFRRSWEQLGTDGEVLEKFALQVKKLEEAVSSVIEFLGMQPVDGTGTVPPPPAGSSSANEKRTHVLHLSGTFIGNVSVLVRAQFQMEMLPVEGSNASAMSVVLKVAVRSSSEEISRLVADCIQ